MPGRELRVAANLQLHDPPVSTVASTLSATALAATLAIDASISVTSHIGLRSLLRCVSDARVLLQRSLRWLQPASQLRTGVQFAHEVRARGSNQTECASACNEVNTERSCSYSINGHQYGMCASCSDIIIGDQKCSSGVGSVDACHAGCDLSAAGRRLTDQTQPPPTSPPPPPPPPTTPLCTCNPGFYDPITYADNSRASTGCDFGCGLQCIALCHFNTFHFRGFHTCIQTWWGCHPGPSAFCGVN